MQIGYDRDLQPIVDYMVNDSKRPPSASYWDYLYAHPEIAVRAQSPLPRAFIRKSRSRSNRRNLLPSYYYDEQSKRKTSVEPNLQEEPNPALQ